MMASSLALAETIAAMSPVAIQGTKINLNYARDHSVEASLDFAVSEFSKA
jgi:delta(3,5)-delta(2,4)-dienoyl-CoA isomerase